MSEELSKKYREVHRIALNEVYDKTYDFAMNDAKPKV